MNLEEIQRNIIKGRDIENLVEKVEWKDFENICSEILEKHNYSIKKNFRFKTEKRYEIDILAKQSNNILLIDCKHWKIRKGKASQLRQAARKQKEREKEFNKIKFLDSSSEKTHSLIITLFQEDIIKEDDVWIIPVFMLNSFLLEIDNYLG